MIADAVLGWVAALLTWVAGLLTLPAPPTFVADLPGYASQLADFTVGTGAWVPWGLLGTVLVAYSAIVVTGFAIKLARIAASFFTAGGGSAA